MADVDRRRLEDALRRTNSAMTSVDVRMADDLYGR